MKLSLLFCTGVILGVIACESYPKDPNRTLEQVRNDTLHVGITHHPPWTVIRHDSVYSGLEVEMIRDFAKELNAKISWTHASETVLMQKLDRYELHVVIGGFKTSSPWNKSAGFTNPYYKKHALAATDGENAFIIRLEKFLNDHKESFQQKAKGISKGKN